MPDPPTIDDPEPWRTLLVFHALDDPLYLHHGIRRPPNYRLKLLLKRMLRDYGFRVTACKPCPVPDPDLTDTTR